MISKEIKNFDEAGRKHGLQVEYYQSNGAFRLRGTFHHDERHGCYEFYHGNGDLKFKGFYKRDILLGFFFVESQST